MSPPSPQSVPLKKRSKIVLDKKGKNSNNASDHEEEAAAAALASLSEKAQAPVTSSLNHAEDDGDVSDSEASYTSQNKVVPKPIHAPVTNPMMVNHTYTDYSVISEDTLAFLEADEQQNKLSEEEKEIEERRIRKIKKIFGDIGPSRKNSGGVVKPFPEKLMEVLDRSDMENIITWMPHGRAFIVLQPSQLKDIVLPRFFKQTKFMSFTRQLNLWGFKRITKGVDAGAYYHELFLRGRPRLSMLMRRQKIKGTGIKLTPNPETEPDFYRISDKRPLPAVDPSKKDCKPLPPLRHSNPVRPMESRVNSYDNMVRRLNDLHGVRQPQNNIGEQQQVYPFQNPNQMSTLPGNNVRGLMPPLNPNLGNQDFLGRQQNFPNAHRSFQQPSDAELVNMLQQRILMEQQQQQQQQNAILSAQQLLSEVGRGPNMNPVPTANMGGNSMHISGLKQRLLEAARSLDNIQPQQQQPIMHHPQHHQHFMNDGGMNSSNIHQMMGVPQQQPDSSSHINALMNALQDTRNVAYSTQARLQQVTRELANVQNRHAL